MQLVENFRSKYKLGLFENPYKFIDVNRAKMNYLQMKIDMFPVLLLPNLLYY